MFLDRLFPFPESLEPKRGTKEFRHIRALTAMLVTTTATALFWTLVLIAIYILSGKPLTAIVAVSLAVSIILALQTWCFYRFANVRFSAMFLSTSYFLIVLVIVFFSGGYDSPSKVLLISSPIISFRISGKEQGITNTLFVAIIGLVLIYAKYNDFVLDNFFPGPGDFFTTSVSWIVTLTVITTCLSAYDVDE